MNGVYCVHLTQWKWKCILLLSPPVHAQEYLRSILSRLGALQLGKEKKKVWWNLQTKRECEMNLCEQFFFPRNLRNVIYVLIPNIGNFSDIFKTRLTTCLLCKLVLSESLFFAKIARLRVCKLDLESKT